MNAEVDAVDAAEVMEGVVDDARVEEPDAEAEPDPDADLEARLANEHSQKEGDPRRRRTRRRRRRTTRTCTTTLTCRPHDPVDDAEADELIGSDLRDGESTRLSKDIVDIGDIHKLNCVPMSARSFVSVGNKPTRDSNTPLGRDLGGG